MAGTRTIRSATGGSPQPGRFPCRVRSADGTWRHVESTVSRYRDAAGADRLLITARDVSDQVALRRQLTYLTFHDGLTGLPNRAYVEDRAKDAIDRSAAEPGQPQTQAGAIFIDLDGFTGVNDSVGHGAGDLLLAQAARRLRAAVPPQDTVARWGGDEFAVLVESAASARGDRGHRRAARRGDHRRAVPGGQPGYLPDGEHRRGPGRRGRARAPAAQRGRGHVAGQGDRAAGGSRSSPRTCTPTSCAGSRWPATCAPAITDGHAGA